jgi:hypothetical protein
MALDVSQATRGHADGLVRFKLLQTLTEYDYVSDEESDISQEQAKPSIGPRGATHITTIHEAELASGPSGAVEYGAEIDELAAYETERRKARKKP